MDMNIFIGSFLYFFVRPRLLKTVPHLNLIAFLWIGCVSVLVHMYHVFL